MSDTREPPPLFDDEDSRKEDENDDLFASAVQSPVGDVTTAPDSQKPHHDQVVSNDPLTAVETVSDAPVMTPELFDADLEPVTRGFSSVALDEPVDGLQQVSTAVDSNGCLLDNDTDHVEPEPVVVPGIDPDSSSMASMSTAPNGHFSSSGQKEVSLDDEDDQNDTAMFQSTVAPQLQLNQDAAEPVPSTVLPPMGAPITPPGATPSLSSPTMVYHSINNRSSFNNMITDEQIERASGDEFFEVSISDPQKIGDGMGAYMAYKVSTKTNIQYFKKKNWSVTRRFSDFLGLHGKLVEKHLQSGRIIPPAPEKSAIASTKIKLGSDKNADSGSAEFIERRRAALERYMVRTGAHPMLRADPDFREFVELDSELPKATQTSAMSSAGVLRLFNRVGETVNKMTYKMEESDQWFEEKTQQIESIDAQLRKLHAAMEGLVGYRRELAHSTLAFSKSSALLSSVEEHTALSRALHQLAEASDRIQTIQHTQGDADFYHLSETTKDYINLIAAVKDVFHERVKTFQIWQHAQTMLAKKRENKAKAEMAGRLDKVQQAQEEVQEWEVKVERSHTEFDRISRAIKKEMEQFDIVRVTDLKNSLVKYLEALVITQQQIIKVWETFIPEAKAIA